MAESASHCRYCLSMPLMVNHTLTLATVDEPGIDFTADLTGTHHQAVRPDFNYPAFRTKFAKRSTAVRNDSDWLVSNDEDCERRPATSPVSAATLDTFDRAVLTCVVPAAAADMLCEISRVASSCWLMADRMAAVIVFISEMRSLILRMALIASPVTDWLALIC